MDMQPLWILLVEDNPGDADLIEEALRETGGRITVTRSVRLKEALDHIASQSPDIVLLDLSLPDAQGLETVTRVCDAAPRLPVVVMTGLADEAVAAAALQKGAQDYLVKGTMEGELVMRAIRYAIERKRMVDELFQRAEELKRSNERLKELDRMKSEFVSVVSHELRTPMTSIKSALGLMKDGTLGTLNEEQQEYVDLLQRNIDRLAALVEDVLSISRMESGKLKLERSKVDLGGLVDDVIATLKHKADEKEDTLEREVGSQPLPAVFCDPDKITQVLINLAGNAISHNPPGVTVTIGAEPFGGKVRVWVRDNGLGIPEEEQEKIFEPFYRIRSKTAQKDSGTGLGLPICRGLVEAHGGELKLESELEKGTTFFFNLESA